MRKFILSVFCLALSASALADLRYLEFVNTDWSQSSVGTWSDSNGNSGTYGVKISIRNSEGMIHIEREYTWDHQTLIVESKIDKDQSVLNTIYDRAFTLNNGFGNCRPGFQVEMVESMHCHLTATIEGGEFTEFWGLHVGKINHYATIRKDDGVVVSFSAMHYRTV